MNRNALLARVPAPVRHAVSVLYWRGPSALIRETLHGSVTA